MSNTVNNKRIAKNTLMLYIRTLFVMVISLYTSRVVLQVLGVEDYGVYQVVGGLVAMFSVISSSLSSAISRFITFEIGRGDMERLKRIFSTSIIIQLCLCVIVALAVEIGGLWFMHTEMQIPAGRLDAAEWVLHCSVLTFCINLLSIPYNACIIAHEHMKAFAYVSVVEAMLKLVILFLIIHSPIDRLVAYALLLTLAAALIRLAYTVYCHKHFEETKTKLIFDKSIFKEMSGFSGWSFFNNTSFILNNQGVSMLMNVFFGVTVNAARGIAIQVESAVLQFVNNFTTALNPQITKSYANGDLDNMYKLVCRGAKFSFFSMLILSLPIILEANQILSLWLTKVPEHTVIFVQLSMIMGMCDCIGTTGYTACMATGKLKRYSLTLTPLIVLEFPLSWLLFYYGASVESSYYLYILIKLLVLFVRMYLMQSMIGLNCLMYIKGVFLPITLTTLFSIIFPMLIITFMDENILRFFILLVVSTISVIVSVLFLGMTRIERNIIIQKSSNLFSKIIKR